MESSVLMTLSPLSHSLPSLISCLIHSTERAAIHAIWSALLIYLSLPHLKVLLIVTLNYSSFTSVIVAYSHMAIARQCFHDFCSFMLSLFHRWKESHRHILPLVTLLDPFEVPVELLTIAREREIESETGAERHMSRGWRMLPFFTDTSDETAQNITTTLLLIQ